MPIITVNVWEEQLDRDAESRIIASMTAAAVEVLGDQVRPYVNVLVVGVPQRRWGVGGSSAETPDGGVDDATGVGDG